AQEYVPRAIGIGRGEIGSQTFEHNVTSIPAHPGVAAITRGLNVSGPNAETSRGVQLPVRQKNVLAIVRVTSDEIGRRRLKNNVSTMAADSLVITPAIAGRAVAALAQAFDCRRVLAVHHENVLLQIVVLAGEIEGGRCKGDIAAITAQ